MSTVEIVKKKVAILPQEIQLQVLDFVNYLAAKYEVEEDDAILEDFLLKRAKQLKKSKRINADNLRNNIYNKYGQDV